MFFADAIDSFGIKRIDAAEAIFCDKLVWGGVDAKNTESDKSLPGSMDTAVGFRAATLVSFNKT